MSTITYRAAGMTDDVTTCEHCGKAELKGTVRMLITDDGEDTGEEIYAGVTCAARLSGRKATAIRTEANRADRAAAQARRDVWNAWDVQRVLWQQAFRDRTIGRYPRPEEIRAWYATDDYRSQEAAWLGEHPEPAR